MINEYRTYANVSPKFGLEAFIAHGLNRGL
jgi:hypothetical protein